MGDTAEENPRTSGTRRAVVRGVRRVALAVAIVVLVVLVAYQVWSPGRDVRDGRHDVARNGIWIEHGWLADDLWFKRDGKTELIPQFRDRERIEALAKLLRDHHITDVFPHLCPAQPDGRIPEVDDEQVERFLDAFGGFRVMPWVGGVGDGQPFPDPAWRGTFVESVRALLETHPRFAGVHVNIEPCPSGNAAFLDLLDELRGALPDDKLLSVAAYPPPTRWHPHPDVHWDRAYYEQVAQRADQLAVMMYDTSIRFRKVYQRVMASWTRQVLGWSGDADVLLGLPAYDDEGVGYHVACVENVRNALLGVHAGLGGLDPLPANYQGLAIYCEWEMDDAEWAAFAASFLKPE